MVEGYSLILQKRRRTHRRRPAASQACSSCHALIVFCPQVEKLTKTPLRGWRLPMCWVNYSDCIRTFAKAEKKPDRLDRLNSSSPAPVQLNRPGRYTGNPVLRKLCVDWVTRGIELSLPPKEGGTCPVFQTSDTGFEQSRGKPDFEASEGRAARDSTTAMDLRGADRPRVRRPTGRGFPIHRRRPSTSDLGRRAAEEGSCWLSHRQVGQTRTAVGDRPGESG